MSFEKAPIPAPEIKTKKRPLSRYWRSRIDSKNKSPVIKEEKEDEDSIANDSFRW